MVFDLESAQAEVDIASSRRFSESREQARIFCAEEILPDALDEIKRLQLELTQTLKDLSSKDEIIKKLKKEVKQFKSELKTEQGFTNSYIKRLHDAEVKIEKLEEVK